MRTFFNGIMLSFPEPIDGKIGTQRFLDASKSVVSVIERFGKVFAAVKYDMNGNITKINNKFCQNKERYTYLNDMIICEKESGGIVTIDALMWLRRALHFFHNFFFYLYEDNQQNKKSEDITPYVRKAYTVTLEQYHGWVAKHLFGLLSRMVPSRSQIIAVLTDSNEELEDIVFQEIDMFLKGLNTNIVLLCTFYAENNLESFAKYSHQEKLQKLRYKVQTRTLIRSADHLEIDFKVACDVMSCEKFVKPMTSQATLKSISGRSADRIKASSSPKYASGGSMTSTCKVIL